MNKKLVHTHTVTTTFENMVQSHPSYGEALLSLT